MELDGRIKHDFKCPHCGYKQTRVFPRRDGPNYCNQCQKDMGKAPADRDKPTEQS